MATRTKKRPRSTSTDTLPTREKAATELLRREVRTITWMLVRLVGVAVLVTLLIRNTPALLSWRPLFDGIGGILVLAPLFTGLGRTFAWRIALGKAYNDAKRWEDTEAILTPLSGLRARLFDAAGEGRFYRAQALSALNRTDEAGAVWRQVAEEGREPWRSQAAQKIA